MEGLDGVLKDWLNGLHDTESALHIVNLWLHALDGLHLSGDLNEWLSVIESLEDSSGKGLLNVLDGSGLGNGGGGVVSGLGSEGSGEGGGEVGNEGGVGLGGKVLNGGDELGVVVMVVVSGGDNSNGGESGEFHFNFNIIKQIR